MAPRRIPDQIHIAEGTFQNRFHGNPEEIVQAAGLPTPGDLTGEALAAWNELIPPLIALKIVKEIDSTCLRMMCEAYAEYKKLRALMALSTDKDTKEYRRLAIGANEAGKQFHNIASRFAMTSSDRSGIRVPRDPKTYSARKRV